MIKKWFSNIGPATLVAAAFIGPGTVTMCSLAGVNFGFTLLWALLFSVVITVLLQEMSARLGVISQNGLAENIRNEIKQPIIKFSVLVLILSAIVIGNAAYQAGNIGGAVLGLETIVEFPKLEILNNSINTSSLIIGAIAFVFLFIGSYKTIERILITLVVFMSLSFLITAILTKPDLGSLASGLFTFETPSGSLLTIVGLIGTTVVPYNLFLHAALVKEKWHKASDLSFARKDTVVAVVLGGLVSMSIIVSAAGIQNTNIENASDLALGLAPLYGDVSTYIMALGLFAAGITSAITAPLAAAYVATGCLGWSIKMKSNKFRAIWMSILLLGVVFASLGIKPIEIIKFAQVTNGLVLPMVAGILIWMMNKSEILGLYINKKWQNIVSILLLLVVLFLGLKSVFQVMKWI
ncbi:Nramp family divalent metal transporter [Paucihalobacter sp.]|uniref:Nramp family divalent metal transporter n=1 Tax=Paucihalobacter sp. TaxID=2850405 RepID=UPI002FDF4694